MGFWLAVAVASAVLAGISTRLLSLSRKPAPTEAAHQWMALIPLLRAVPATVPAFWLTLGVVVLDRAAGPSGALWTVAAWLCVVVWALTGGVVISIIAGSKPKGLIPRGLRAETGSVSLAGARAQ